METTKEMFISHKKRRSCLLWQHGWTWRSLCCEISQAQDDKYRMISLTCGIWKSWARKWREQLTDGGRNGEVLVKGYPVLRQISSWNLRYSMVTLVHSSLLSTWTLLREILNVILEELNVRILIANNNELSTSPFMEKI